MTRGGLIAAFAFSLGRAARSAARLSRRSSRWGIDEGDSLEALPTPLRPSVRRYPMTLRQSRSPSGSAALDTFLGVTVLIAENFFTCHHGATGGEGAGPTRSRRQRSTVGLRHRRMRGRADPRGMSRPSSKQSYGVMLSREPRNSRPRSARSPRVSSSVGKEEFFFVLGSLPSTTPHDLPIGRLECAFE